MADIVKPDEFEAPKGAPHGDPAKYIRKDVLDTLQGGSLEKKIFEVAGMVSNNKGMFTKEKPDSDVSLLATFEDNRAVVGTSDGKVFRVEFEGVPGDLKIKKIEPIELAVLDKAGAEETVKSEARGLIGKFIETGVVDQAMMEGVISMREFLA